MGKIIVTGGAGYIGGYVCKALETIRKPEEIFIVDDLRTGHRDQLEHHPHLIEDIMTADPGWDDTDGVIHMAAATSVAESVEKPDYYRHNNFDAPKRFLAEAVKRKIPVVFSSTAAVYGEPEKTPIPEDHPTKPINPYGETKLALEQWLIAEGLCASLRYFNAAGGLERHDPETHLIPLLLRSQGTFKVFGNDYPTPDGTCVRDFIHVEDLARAHVLALGKHGIWNLGCGKGYSVLEVVTKAGRKPDFQPRRTGDPAVLVADNTRAKADLGWEPTRTLEEILSENR